MEDKHEKFSEAEIMLGIFFFGGLDVISILLDITVVGLVIAPVIQSFGTLSATLWLWNKGDKNTVKFGRQVAKYAANTLPIVPTLVIAFVVEAYLHNHPKLKKLAAPKTARLSDSTLKAAEDFDKNAWRAGAIKS